MRDARFSAAADGIASRKINRRTALAGAFGALFGIALTRPSQVWGHAATPTASADAPFDPTLARRLQTILDDAVASSGGGIPGALLHVEHDGHGGWTGASGFGQLDPDVAIQPGDRFSSGSIVKPFVAATVLQLAEGGHFTLDASLPAVLPADVISRFTGASEITVRMLLGHRSGLPDWDSSDVDASIVSDLGKNWTDSDLLDLAPAKESLFSPGTDYSYSNTNYTLLGLIIEHATGADWRDEVTNGVIKPLELEATALPAPGDRSLGGPHAHGYVDVNGELLDVSTADPSMFGAAGGNALVTSVSDLVRFMNALLAGRLFQHPETLNAMLDFKPATEEPGQIGYGLGLLQRALPGGIETIDHLGGAIGYRAYVARLPHQQVTLATAMNSLADPSLLVLPVLGAFATSEG